MTRTVVISGGGSGMGRAIAASFAADGDDVWILGRRAGVLRGAATELGPTVRPYPVDLTDPAAVEAFAADLTAADRTAAGPATNRGVDVIVANAGAPPPRPDSTGLAGLAGTAAVWQATWQTNVLTAVLLVEALAPSLSRPGGRVVLVSSIAAHNGGGGPYSAAKAALHGWAFDLAGRFGQDGITANVIAPGFVDDTEFFRGRMTDQRRQSLVDRTLVGRAGEPADIAHTVRYLASPAASWVTGQVLGVNGGAALGR